MKQVQDAQEIPASQIIIDQENNSLNDQIEDVSLSFTGGLEQDEKAQNEEYPFWLSWYSATMLLSLGFFLYYFPRLIGFPDATFQVTDIIATISDIIGFLIALLLFFVAFSKIAGELITFGTLTFLCSMPIIFVMRLAVRQGRYGEVTAVFLLLFQMIALLEGMLIIYLVFFALYQEKLTKGSIMAFLQMVTVKRVFTFLLAVIGAVTVIVPFIQLILSLITGKH